MAGHFVASKLGRTSSAKRKRSDITPDIDGALRKLRQLTNRLETSRTDQPLDIRSLVDLLQMQTAVIEALALQLPQKQNSTIERVKQYRPQLSSTRTSKHDRTSKTLEDIAEATSPQPSIRSLLVVDSGQVPAEPLLKAPANHMIQYLTPPQTPERQHQHPRESFEVPLKISSSLLPPTPPPKDRKDDARFSSSRLSTTNTETRTLRQIHSPRLSPSALSSSSTRTPRPCTTCTTKQWVLQNKDDPSSIDLARESAVQQAATRLITNTKSEVRTSIGPLNDGVFNLYSSEYRKHYCVHDRPDRQSLLVYSSSSTWASEFPGVPPPAEGQIAMELLVYPDCLLIVKPFRVPRYAGWKWCTLDAMGDHAKPTTVEVMFLGDGYLKLKVRLSELLGWERMRGENDRFIEFSGVWNPTECVEEGETAWESC